VVSVVGVPRNHREHREHREHGAAKETGDRGRLE